MGQTKAWLPFGQEPMLPRIVRVLQQAVSPVAVVAASGQELPPLPSDVAIVFDEKEGQGPLQGLAAGLMALHGKAEAAYVSSCDVPFLKPALIRRMIELLGDHQACVPEAAGFTHPLAAVYRLDALPAVRELLLENCLRPTALLGRIRTRVVTAVELHDVDPGLESLCNLNTPEDYERALEILRSRQAISEDNH